MRSKWWAIGRGVALVAVAGVLAAIWSNGTKKSAACSSFKHAPAPAAATQALANYTNRIEHGVTHTTSGLMHDEWWNDPIAGRRRQLSFDQNGQIESEFVTTTNGPTERSVWVLYSARRVLITEHTFPASLTRNNSGAAQIAQGNRDRVANGKAAIVGQTRVDGRVTLHLRQTIPPLTPAPPAGTPMPAFRVDTWVDPLTYLTVRTRYGGPTSSSVTDETWLPRTPANIAKTKLVVPTGFKRFTPGNGSGVGFSTGHVLLYGCQS